LIDNWFAVEILQIPKGSSTLLFKLKKAPKNRTKQNKKTAVSVASLLSSIEDLCSLFFKIGYSLTYI